MAVVGLLDDLLDNGLPPKVRLASQAVAGIISGAPDPLAPLKYAAVVNAVNFMDGIDGMTTMTAACWGVNAAFMDGADLRALGAIVAGDALGFLPWNLNGRQFLGDVGSYQLGALIAAGVVIDGRQSAIAVSPLIPYLADTGLTLLRRYLRGDSVTQAHREHSYQRLVHDAGMTHLNVSALYAFSSAAITVVRRTLPRVPAMILTSLIVGTIITAPHVVNARRIASQKEQDSTSPAAHHEGSSSQGVTPFLEGILPTRGKQD